MRRRIPIIYSLPKCLCLASLCMTACLPPPSPHSNRIRVIHNAVVTEVTYQGSRKSWVVSDGVVVIMVQRDSLGKVTYFEAPHHSVNNPLYQSRR